MSISNASEGLRQLLSKRTLTWVIILLIFMLMLYLSFNLFQSLEEVQEKYERLQKEYKHIGIILGFKEYPIQLVDENGIIASGSHISRFIPAEKNYTYVPIHLIELDAWVEDERGRRHMKNVRLAILLSRKDLDAYIWGGTITSLPVEIIGSDIRLPFILPPALNAENGFYICIKNLENENVKYKLKVYCGEYFVTGKIYP